MPAASTDGRGRYDRSASASERARQARAAILDAVTRLLSVAPGVPSVDDVCGLTGLGRNTFYGHFRNTQAAVDQVVVECLAKIQLALERIARAAVTPYTEAQEFAEGWFQFCDTERESVLAVHAAARDEFCELLRTRLATLHATGADAGVYRQKLELERFVALCGATMSLSVAVASDRGRTSSATAALVDAILGLCR